MIGKTWVMYKSINKGKTPLENSFSLTHQLTFQKHKPKSGLLYTRQVVHSQFQTKDEEDIWECIYFVFINIHGENYLKLSIYTDKNMYAYMYTDIDDIDTCF